MLESIAGETQLLCASMVRHLASNWGGRNVEYHVIKRE
jgi:hypothetical protein